MLLEAILEVSCCYYSQLWCADKESMDVWIWRVRVMKILEVDWMNSLGQTTARLSPFSTNEPSRLVPPMIMTDIPKAITGTSEVHAIESYENMRKILVVES
jgi:hypothetical protein